jgi:excisionase family DNA binding protein
MIKLPKASVGAEPAIAPTRRAFSVKEFCQAFGLSRSTAYNLMADGTLRSVRVAGRRLIPADSAEALLSDERA